MRTVACRALRVVGLMLAALVALLLWALQWCGFLLSVLWGFWSAPPGAFPGPDPQPPAARRENAYQRLSGANGDPGRA